MIIIEYLIQYFVGILFGVSGIGFLYCGVRDKEEGLIETFLGIFFFNISIIALILGE